MTTPPRIRTRWPGLDSLRGLAVVAVVAYHLGHLRGGFLGVDVFFVLSGYLVTALALDEVDRTGSLGLRAFWGRRVRRLGPALFVMVPTVLAAAVLLRWDRTTFDRLAWDATATLTWWANWREAFGEVGGYWSPTPSLFRHAWSLGIEEQFYLIWPLVFTAALLAARRLGRHAAAAVAVTGSVLVVASTTWSIVLANRLPTADLSRVYVGTDTRIAAPLLGCVLAAVLHRRPLPTDGRRLTIVRTAGLAAASGLLILVVRVDIASPNLYRTGLLPLASLLAAVTLAGARTITRTDPVTTWLGHRSYAIYLWSWPIQILAHHQRPDWGIWALTAFTVPLSLVLAEISWHLVEHPAQRRTRWAHRPVTRRIVGSLLVVGAAFAVAVITHRAVPPPDHQRIDTAESVDDVVHRPPPPVAGDQDDPDRPERVMLVGDSVAWTIGYRTDPADLPPDIASVDSRAAIGCGILAPFGYEGRDEEGEWALIGEDGCRGVLDGLAVGLSGEPDVLLMMPGAWEWSEMRGPDGGVVPARSDEMATLLREHLLDLARDADGIGARTVIVEWACPGPKTIPERRGDYIGWINGVLDRTAAAGRDEGLDIVLAPTPETVCVGADPEADATDDKNAAMGGEVHVLEEEGAVWLWENWLGPAIRDSRTPASTGTG